MTINVSQPSSPVLLLCALAVAALIHGVMGKQHQSFDGLIVLDVNHYEFYPDAKDCNRRGTPYLLVPNSRFHEIVNASTSDLQHPEDLLHSQWRAKLNGNLSHIGRNCSLAAIVPSKCSQRKRVVKLILFDIDGTLVNSQNLIVEAQARAFASLGMKARRAMRRSRWSVFRCTRPSTR